MSKTEFYHEWIEKYHVNTLGLSECIERWDYLYQKQKGQIYLCRPWPGITVWANKVFMETLPCETAGMRYPFLYLLAAGHLKPVKKAYVTSGQKRIADETEKCICRNLQTAYTVEQLALQAGVSASSLKKYFAMVYGCPISEYIRRKRMEYACALLKDTDQSIADIAEQAGYAHHE